MIDIRKLSNTFSARKLDERDADTVLKLCLTNPDYYECCGQSTSRDDVLNDMRITPPGIDIKDKYYTGFFDGDELIAVMDLIDGYPRPDIAFIGFFMVTGTRRGQGTGSGIISDTCAYLMTTGRSAVRLAWASDNLKGARFWQKNGFFPGESHEMGGWTAISAEKRL